MLALVSIKRAIRRCSTSPKSNWAAWRRNGLANANASKESAAARSKSKSQLSSRLRRVRRGGVGDKNMSELNGTSPLGARRIKWKMTGAARASRPRT